MGRLCCDCEGQRCFYSDSQDLSNSIMKWNVDSLDCCTIIEYVVSVIRVKLDVITKQCFLTGLRISNRFLIKTLWVFTATRIILSNENWYREFFPNHTERRKSIQQSNAKKNFYISVLRVSLFLILSLVFPSLKCSWHSCLLPVKETCPKCIELILCCG